VDALWRRGLSGAGVTIGHLDTGVAGDHPALAGRVADFIEFDQDGRVVPGSDAAPRDTGSHGTHTAGLLCGGEHSGRPMGVAPGARLLSAAVVEGGNNVVRVLRGLDWLRGSGIGVVCMALGVPGDNPVFWTMVAALRAEDVLIVCPVGNLGSRYALAPGSHPGVLAVGAMDQDGTLSSFTGCSRDDAGRCRKPDVLAPGDDLVSAHPRLDVEAQSGTSQAAALVAGVAALLRQACPRATAYQIEQALCRSARAIDSRQGHRYRAGAIEPMAALDLLGRDLDRMPRYRRVPRQPPCYRDPGLLAACRRARPHARLECVIIVDQAVPAVRGPGRAAVVLDSVARALGEPMPAAEYLPRARAAIVATTPRFIRALAADARVRVLCACAARNQPLPW
jgi:hypothetical protein